MLSLFEYTLALEQKQMAFFDLSLEQLQTYRPERSEPADFDAFWQQTLESAHSYDLNAQFKPYDSGLRHIAVYDVTFSGYGGQSVKGWYMRPADVDAALPGIVHYIGYGGGRGYPHDWLMWPAAGYALLVMDTRGQGSAWRQGDTPDLPDGANPSHPGFMTQGILDPKTYYYRRVYVDAVRAVEALLTREDVDPARIALTGGSQGGGLTLAAAALLGDRVALAMADVPFLCQFRRAVGLTNANPYHEIVRYLSVHRDREAQVFGTLDYFDGVNMAPRVTARCLLSTGLMDTVCPPSTVFAAYNYLDAPKEMRVYRFNEHEGGASRHDLEKLHWVNGLWG